MCILLYIFINYLSIFIFIVRTYVSRVDVVIAGVDSHDLSYLCISWNSWKSMKKPSKMAFFGFSTRYPRNAKNAKFTTGISRGFFWKSLFSAFWHFRRGGHFWRFLRDSELFVFVFRMYFIYLDYMFFYEHVSRISCNSLMFFMCFTHEFHVWIVKFACVLSCKLSRA